MLLKKSKEFAQKYNVDLEVDEIQLEKVADTLSVEQMERDYIAWSNLINKSITNTSHHAKSFESTSISDCIKGEVENNHQIEYEISYNFGNNGSGMVRVRLSIFGSDGITYLQPLGFSAYGTNKCSFTANGPITLTGGLYHGTYRVWVDHKYTGKTTVYLTRN